MRKSLMAAISTLAMMAAAGPLAAQDNEAGAAAEADAAIELSLPGDIGAEAGAGATADDPATLLPAPAPPADIAAGAEAGAGAAPEGDAGTAVTAPSAVPELDAAADAAVDAGADAADVFDLAANAELLVGKSVETLDGETVGEVEAVLPAEDRIIVASGGFLGLFRDQTAIPAAEINFDAASDIVVLTMTEAEFRAAADAEAGDAMPAAD